MNSPGADAFETSIFHQRPFFTIVTVTLNDSRGVLRTRSSLEMQTYSRWLHVVIDGKSDLQHFQRLQTLQNSGKTLLISEVDEGIYHAMNKGWKKAPNDSFVIFLNSGDVLASDKSLEIVASEISKKGCPDVVFTPIEQSDENKDNWVCLPVKRPRIENQLFATGYVSHQGTIMKRCVIEELGGFDTKFKVAADWDLIVRAIKSRHFEVLQHCLSHFYTGGYSSKQIATAHNELRALRHRYLNVTPTFLVCEFLWEMVYLRFIPQHKIKSVIIFFPFYLVSGFIHYLGIKTALAKLSKFYLKFQLFISSRKKRHTRNAMLSSIFRILDQLTRVIITSVYYPRRFLLQVLEPRFRNWLYARLSLVYQWTQSNASSEMH